MKNVRTNSFHNSAFLFNSHDACRLADNNWTMSLWFLGPPRSYYMLSEESITGAVFMRTFFKNKNDRLYSTRVTSVNFFTLCTQQPVCVYSWIKWTSTWARKKRQWERETLRNSDLELGHNVLNSQSILTLHCTSYDRHKRGILAMEWTNSH